jgi:hypothetical protein
MRKACVFDVDGETTPGAGHEVASPPALSRALHALLTPQAPETRRLAACRAGIDHEVEGRLAHVHTLLAAGRREAAQKELTQTDRRFGGLAAPGSVGLQGQLGTP